jgi:hypothetical protein
MAEHILQLVQDRHQSTEFGAMSLNDGNGSLLRPGQVGAFRIRSHRYTSFGLRSPNEVRAESEITTWMLKTC